jgi:hypothetical protein
MERNDDGEEHGRNGEEIGWRQNEDREKLKESFGSPVVSFILENFTWWVKLPRADS